MVGFINRITPGLAVARVNSFTRAAVALLRTPTHPRFEIIVPCDGLDHPRRASERRACCVSPG